MNFVLTVYTPCGGIKTTKAAEISGFSVLPQGVEPWTP